MIFRKDYFFICKDSFDGKGACANIALKNHIINTHTHTPRNSDEGDKAEEKYKKDLITINETERQRALEGNAEIFRESCKRGPKPRGRKTYPQKYYCIRCDTHFHTNLGAMVSHAEAHRRGEIIKIAVIKKGHKNGGFRPEQHIYDAKSEKFHKGSDANYSRIAIPDDNKRDENTLKCKCCKKFFINFPFSNLSVHAQCKRIEKLRKHEIQCSA